MFICVCVCTTLCLEHTCDCAVHPPTCGACVWTHTSAVCRAPCAVTLEASQAPHSLLPPPLRVPPPPKFRDSVTAPPQERSQRGVPSPGEGPRRVAWALAPPWRPLSVQHQHLPAPWPHSPCPRTGDVFPGKHRCAEEAACGSPAHTHPIPALRLLSLPFCQARPRWEISLGVFTSHRLLIA